MIEMTGRLIHILGEVLFPRRCSHCDGIFGTRHRRSRDRPTGPARLGGCLCPACLQKLETITSPLCVTCGRPFATDHGIDHVCAQCEKTARNFGCARAAVGYRSAMRRIIQAYKYQGWVQLAGPLGGMLWEAFVTHWDPEAVDAVIPVPLHRRRMRQRGFNQSAQFLRGWARRSADIIPNSRRFTILPQALIRRRATKPQIGMDADARKANMKDAFTVRDVMEIKAKHVMLVDDVLTTGATVDACAQVLKRAGAASVSVLTLARAV